jgi:cytidine deaminase
MKKYPMGINNTNILSNGMTVHAEINLLSKIKCNKSISILVIRINKEGKLKESKPCYHCLKAMRNSGLNIKYVYYSTSNGNIVKETFSKMTSIYRTRGSR